MRSPSQEGHQAAKHKDVRFEPNDDATVHFRLHEGAAIQVTRSQEDWHQVRRYDGKMGWLKGDVFFTFLIFRTSVLLSDCKIPRRS